VFHARSVVRWANSAPVDSNWRRIHLNWNKRLRFWNQQALLFCIHCSIALRHRLKTYFITGRYFVSEKKLDRWHGCSKSEFDIKSIDNSAIMIGGRSDSHDKRKDQKRGDHYGRWRKMTRKFNNAFLMLEWRHVWNCTIAARFENETLTTEPCYSSELAVHWSTGKCP
jgi:hypothetical protein